MSKKKSQIILAQIEGNEVLVDSSDIKTEYPQIQIVTSVESPSPSLNKNKLIFIGEGKPEVAILSFHVANISKLHLRKNCLTIVTRII